MIVYLIRNIQTNKIYIGQTTNTLEKRWKEHIAGRSASNSFFRRALRKYGAENFEYNEIMQADSQSELNHLEQVFIYLFNSSDSQFGYNLTLGGEGGCWTEERKKNFSAARKGVPKSPEHKAKLTKHLRQVMSKVDRNTWIANISKAKSGKPNPKLQGEKNPMFGKTPPNMESLIAYNRTRPRDENGRYLHR